MGACNLRAIVALCCVSTHIDVGVRLFFRIDDTGADLTCGEHGMFERVRTEQTGIPGNKVLEPKRETLPFTPVIRVAERMGGCAHEEGKKDNWAKHPSQGACVLESCQYRFRDVVLLSRPMLMYS